MKLNLDFSKYIGTTRLKIWWREVKKHFEAVQTEHNALEDAFSTEVTQRVNADVGLANRIASGENARASADTVLQQSINGETTARTKADDEIKSAVSELRTKYLGDGSTVTFEWAGDVPDGELTGPGNSEPSAGLDLRGMFKIDGMSCGTMEKDWVLLNYIEENPSGNIEYNGGISRVK